MSIKFINFMNGFSAAVELMRRAQNQGCFVEAVCLSTSVIDSLLRMGLVLKHQLNTKSTEIPENLIYESNNSIKTNERTIYSRCLQSNIINKNLFDKLNTLYTKRNQIVHRYIISEITTEQVLLLSKKFDDIIDKVGKCIDYLEIEQVKTGVGMTHAGKNIPIELRGKSKQLIEELAAKKHGNKNLVKNLRKS